MVSKSEQIALLERLLSEPHELEWLEFKENNADPQTLGKNISALSNSACYRGKQRGYLVFGIEDDTHAVVGTSFDPLTQRYSNQPLQIWLSQNLHPNVKHEIHTIDYHGKRIVIFEINPTNDCPVKFQDKAYIRVGSSTTELYKYPEIERGIWQSHIDWSAQICKHASLEDLDEIALEKARKEYKNKFPSKASEVDSWDDATFLNKTKLTIRGAITNTALLLLGKPESSTLLTSAVAQINWELKNEQNEMIDYELFGMPFLLTVDQVLARIRNLVIRHLPSGTLFPIEVTQYDTWVIREALNNCIAHQDYTLRGRINVVETPASLLMRNVGSFLPGNIEDVIQQDAPSEVYRNSFLAEAMVHLNLIDTQGSGIKRMFNTQRSRFFPLPDYDLSLPDRVKVTIDGRILDEKYTRLLMERTDLPLDTIILLDKVQRHHPISREEHKMLKSEQLVEGRYPNLMISASLAALTDQKAQHIRDRGFNDQYYMDLIVELIREHQPVSRKEIDRLVLDKLPEILTEKQRTHKIHNLLSRLSNVEQRIKRVGMNRWANWILNED